MWARALIKEKLGIHIPDDEIGNIAMHIHTARNNAGDMTQTLDITTMIRDIIEIIEIQLAINIVEDTISYERLVTHLRFAIQHIKAGESIYELDAEMIDIIKEKFKDAFLCALSIGTFVKKEYGFEFPEKNCAILPCIFSGFTSGQSHAEANKNAFETIKSVFIFNYWLMAGFPIVFHFV